VTAPELAAAYGVRVVLTDLGDWGAAALISEYDPDGPEIRIDVRAAARFDEAVAHELYHHREAIGEVPRLASRAAREQAAAEYARTFAT
jgi:hypothetical protein